MPKKIDLTNKVFGFWTVIREATKEEKGQRPGAYWICQCTCGTKKVVNGQTLRKGESLSCGCQTGNIIAKKNNNRAEDLTGRKFGRLTVIERDFEEESNHATRSGTYWKCLCECGNYKTVVRNSLIEGKTQSCGCLRQEVSRKFLTELSSHNFINEVGNRYGKLVVIEKATETYSTHGVMWRCICDCGSETIVSGNSLRQGNTASCGCLGRSKGEFMIASILKEYNIPFSQESVQKIQNHNFRFDFYVDNKYFIEFDGMQHFKPSEHFGGEDYLEYLQNNDKIKNEWCKENNIPLIRIPYTHLNKLCIEDLLLETSEFKI
jgi:hypothetical protein